MNELENRIENELDNYFNKQFYIEVNFYNNYVCQIYIEKELKIQILVYKWKKEKTFKNNVNDLINFIEKELKKL